MDIKWKANLQVGGQQKLSNQPFTASRTHRQSSNKHDMKQVKRSEIRYLQRSLKNIFLHFPIWCWWTITNPCLPSCASLHPELPSLPTNFLPFTVSHALPPLHYPYNISLHYLSCNPSTKSKTSFTDFFGKLFVLISSAQPHKRLGYSKGQFVEKHWSLKRAR